LKVIEMIKILLASLQLYHFGVDIMSMPMCSQRRWIQV